MLWVLPACVPVLAPPRILDNPDGDYDGDGFTENEGDCDDAQPDANPGEDERCGDGIDNDCDGGPGDCGVLGEVGLAGADAVWTSDVAGDAAGYAVAGGVDYDDDGYDDVVIGAPGCSVDGVGDGAGCVHFVRGGDEPASGLLRDRGTHVEWLTAGAAFGAALGGVRDFDSDGLPDLLTGAPLDGDAVAVECGAFYLIGDPLGPPAPGSGLFGSQDEQHLGQAVADAGDVDGDGVGDYAVGGPGFDDGAGVVIVYLGPFDPAQPSNRFLHGSDGADSFGTSLAGVGDVDGDGLDDLVAGAPGFGQAGGAGLFLGPPRRVAKRIDDADTLYLGELPGDRAGWRVAAAGDVDGDGRPDVLLGAPGGDRGATYLFLGAVDPVEFAEDADLRVLGADTGAAVGTSVSMAGDTDGDGVVELLIGGPGAGAGYAWLVPAGAGTVSTDDASATLVGIDVGDGAGASVGGAGDVDGDGLADILVGAPAAAGGAGAVYLLLGGGA